MPKCQSTKIPNSGKYQNAKASKFQNPKSKFQNNTKIPNPKPKTCFENWNLEFVISLLPRLHNPFS
jgi:hypothetical protein